MSGIQIERCEIKNIDKDPLDAKNVLKFDTNSNNVALEVLNDIVENALDSAMYKEDQALRNFRMVGDIMDPYTPRSTKITELSDTPLTKNQKLTPTEEEVKKFIGEINSPTPKGTGDQLQENEEIITKKKSFSFPKNFSLEKKTRLTDLVRNSKSVISKFLSTENAKTKESEWEEKNEEFVKSIELNQLNKSHVSQENSRQPLTSSNSNDMIKIPDDGEMENINLKDVPGNEDLDYIQKSLTFPIASCSRIPVLQQDKDCKERKKWNFGAKLVNYIKKKASRRDMTKSEV